MTVTSTTSRVEYIGDGTTVTFSVPFYFIENGDLNVYVGGTLQIITTNYTVAGAGVLAGGSITFVSPPANLSEVIIFRNPALTQGLDYIDNDDFPAESHELGLDRLTMITQRNRDLLNRSLRLPDSTVGFNTELPQPVASRLLGLNAAGDGIQFYELGDTPGTAASITYEPLDYGVNTTVKDALDSFFVSEYKALRLYTGIVKTARITGVLATAQPQAIAGTFQYDATDTASGALFTASQTGTTLTVTSVTNGTLAVGQAINRSDTGAKVGYISALGTGSGGVGTYTISASATITSQTFTADNGGTYLVGVDGRRWKRVPINQDEIFVDWFEPDGANDQYAFNLAFDVANVSGANKWVVAGSGSFTLAANVTMNPNTTDGDVPNFRGQGPQNTIITLAAGVSFVHQGASPSRNGYIGDFHLIGAGAGTVGNIGIYNKNTCFRQYNNITATGLRQMVMFENVGAGFSEQNVLTNCWDLGCFNMIGYRRAVGSTQNSFRGTGLGFNCHKDLRTVSGSRLAQKYEVSSLECNVYDAPMYATIWSDTGDVVFEKDATDATPWRLYGNIQYESVGAGWSLGTGGGNIDEFRGSIGGISNVPSVGTFRTLPNYSFDVSPAFAARNAATQTITTNTFTKVNINTEDYDTNANYDTTNNRFTPTVAGKYRFVLTIRGTGTTITDFIGSVYKNGVESIRGWQTAPGGNSETQTAVFDVDMNGTTDYVEPWGLITAGGTVQFDYVNAAVSCRFSGSLIKTDSI